MLIAATSHSMTILRKTKSRNCGSTALKHVNNKPAFLSLLGLTWRDKDIFQDPQVAFYWLWAVINRYAFLTSVQFTFNYLLGAKKINQASMVNTDTRWLKANSYILGNVNVLTAGKLTHPSTNEGFNVTVI